MAINLIHVKNTLQAQGSLIENTIDKSFRGIPLLNRIRVSTVTCTGRACYWIGGSNHKDPGVVREKGSYYTGYDYQRRAYYNPIPSRYQDATPEEEAEVVKQFSDKIKVLPFRSLYAYHLPNDTDTELFPETDETLLLSELCSFVHWSLNSIREVAGGKPYELPRTRKQHESEFWESERAIRISASKSKLFLGLTSESAKINYFRKNMWGFKRPPTEAMLLGIKNEAIARKKYIEEYMKPDDPNAKMHQTGSWVNPAYPMLLCTPDGIIEGSSQCKLFETKYCHILQGADPRDF
ncbi:DNA-directed RNA polymerase subunit beta' [Frankliniella fusca]|uniref:DNA-directed RNA polymerase subunit beta n=1 Tax=Frankliniella fusca TaxID=407009 RepID=A0AAE1L6J2_9NEOP|nr:DNA-directed RNA polymerase subunit beta' [Frankliniella fusca]